VDSLLSDGCLDKSHRQDKQQQQFLVLMEDDCVSLLWRMGRQPCILTCHAGTTYQVAGAGYVLVQLKVCTLQSFRFSGTITKLLKGYFKIIVILL